MMRIQEYTDQLQQLIEFKTVTGNVHEIKQAFEYVQRLVDPRAFIEYIDHQSAPMLLLSNMKTKTPNIMFLSHIDVVAGHDRQFAAEKKGNLLYGRGASDMKFSIPMGIELLNEAIRSGDAKSFLFVLTSDEESGGFLGAKSLADIHNIQPEVLIVLDGGDNLNLIHSSKGIEVIEFTVIGCTSHASEPYLGKNPHHVLLQLGYKLLQRFKRDDQDTNGTTIHIDEIIGPTNKNPHNEIGSMCATICYGPTEHATAIQRDIESIVHDVDPSIRIHTAASGLPTQIDTSRAAFVLFHKLLAEEMKRDITTKLAPGGSDARHFVTSHPAILMTKPLGGNIHGAGEYINLQSCMSLLHALFMFLHQYKSRSTV